MNKSRKFVEKLEALEAVDKINYNISSLKEGLIPSTLALD
jgi:hypothetical protein